MQRTLLLFILTLCSIVPIQAQEPPINTEGDWNWAHFYYGEDSPFGYCRNYITNTHLDEEGNIYIFGSCGNDAIFDGDEHDPISDCPRTDSPHSGDHNGILLAKYNQEGTLLWKKFVKGNFGSNPHWMDVTDSLIYIVGDYCFGESAARNGWLFFYDTLITERDIEDIPREEQQYPFKIEDITFYSILDFDGNVLETTFMGYYQAPLTFTPIDTTYRFPFYQISPFKVDADGNIYQILMFNSYAEASSDTMSTYIYTSDTMFHYNIIIPRSENDGAFLGKEFLVKFSPDWEMLWYKPIVQNSDGFIPMRNSLDSSMFDNTPIYNYSGIDIDEDANIYLTGEISPLNVNANHDCHNYPCHIYFDSNVYITMEREEELPYFPFLVKFDSTGTPQWCQQVHRQNGPNSRMYGITHFRGVDIEGDAVYVPFYVGINRDQTVTISDDYTITNILGTTGRTMGSFLSYNKETGEFLHHGSAPSIRTSGLDFKQNFVHDNHVFLMGSNDNGLCIDHLTTEGRYIETIPFYQGDFPLGGNDNVSVNSNGDLLAYSSIFNFSGSITPPVPVGEFNLECSPTLSNAVYALYHNDIFAYPYEERPQQILWDQTLTFDINERAVPLTATATSGLPITYRCNDPAVARISNDTLYLLRNGQANIIATQDGSPYYLPADPHSKPLTITGVNDINAPTNETIEVYPNPTNGVIYLSADGIEQIEVLNLTGEPLATFHDTDIIDISDFSSGAYMLKVITHERVYIQKVIKK